MKNQRPESAPFWKAKSLEEMTVDEWESLCDGCARCCLVKLEDEDTGEIHFTDIGCTLLDAKSCRCRDYRRRSRRVPDCVRLTPAAVRTLSWLPAPAPTGWFPKARICRTGIRSSPVPPKASSRPGFRSGAACSPPKTILRRNSWPERIVALAEPPAATEAKARRPLMRRPLTFTGRSSLGG